MASAGLNWHMATACLRPIISKPWRSTASVPWLSSDLRRRSATTLGAAAPWLFSMASQALGWLALIQATASSTNSACVRS
jgi:hypothetical protein